MKKIAFFLCFSVLFQACALKQTKKLVHSGNYDEAISVAVSNLKLNKEKKSKQEYIYLLEEAFAKAKERDLNTLNLLEKDSNPSRLEKIFQTYVGLNNRQEKIKPLLPLLLIKENRNASFYFDNYNEKIISSRNALSEYLYNNAKTLLSNTDKMGFRKAFDDLSYLNEINPNYKNTNDLLKEAKFKGSDYVFVKTINETDMVIPVRLQNDLLDFNTYGLRDQWTVFHTTKQGGINYDFGLVIGFRAIAISPEQINEKEFVKERRIKDGQKKLIDANGKEVLDEKGKVVFVDNFRDVTVRINEFRQFKSCMITAKVEYINWTTNQVMQNFPLTSEFIFENIYANYKGDRRGCDDNYFVYFDRRLVPFPSNEQMIYDTGEDLKNKLKNILNQNMFRN